MRIEPLYLSVVLTLTGLTAALALQPVQAAGFYLTEVGTPGSLGTAGVGNATNNQGAAAAWSNPAGMTGIDEEQVVGGISLAVPKIEFSPRIADKGGNDGGNAGEVAAIPGTFYVKPLGDKWRLGLALSAPLGGGFDFGDNFAGRYTVTKLELTGVGLSTALGYRVNDELSIGGGATLLYSNLNQDLALNQGPLDDGKIKIEDADDFAVQGYVGLTWQMTERAMLGVVYRGEVDSDLKGDIKVQNLLTRFDRAGSIKVSWTNPQWLDIGLRFAAREDLLLMVAGGWQDWSEFSTNQFAVATQAGRSGLSVVDRKFKDTWYLGGAVQKRIGSAGVMSAGLKYESSPVSDANRTLDLPFDETWTVSASYAWKGTGNLDYGLGASLIYFGDAPVDQVSQRVRVAGDFDTNWMLFLGGNLRYRF